MLMPVMLFIAFRSGFEIEIVGRARGSRRVACNTGDTGGTAPAESRSSARDAGHYGIGAGASPEAQHYDAWRSIA